MNVEKMTPNEAYLEGRLLGLSELIGILKDSLEGEGAAKSPVIKSIVLHISNEMDSIISELKVKHGEHPVLKQAEQTKEELKATAEKVAEVQPPQAQEALKKSVTTTDDLMKSLAALRQKTSETKETEAAATESESAGSAEASE